MVSHGNPLFLELAGPPASGKTTTARLVWERFAGRGVPCAIVPEAAARSPLLNLKRRWTFNAWTLCQTVSSVLERTNTQQDDIVVLDRGLIDSLCWIHWFRSRHEIDESTAAALQSFVRIPTWFQQTKIVLILRVRFETALQRRGVAGRILNPNTFEELLRAYEETVRDLHRQVGSPYIHVLDTDDLEPTEVVDYVTSLLELGTPLKS